MSPRIRPEGMTRDQWRTYKRSHPEETEILRVRVQESTTFANPELPGKVNIQSLIDATRKPIGFEALCDRLNAAPAAVRRLLAAAKGNGIDIRIGNDHLQLSPEEQVRTVQQSGIQPTTSKRQAVGVLSDLHLGSKYCLRDQIRDCVGHFYERGIRAVLVPGDLLDGCYQHGVFELSHSGLEDQTQDLCETLPSLPGLTYHCITGNHDHTFAANSGVNVGRFIQGYFKEHGRHDVRFYGSCGAFIQIFGAIIHMWHPLKSCAYALSYGLQKQIESYGAGEKPHILLAGHWHKFAAIEERGVFGVACPCFQASGSTFSKRLGGHPALGGLIVSWEIAGQDLVRNFAVERRRYFEVEQPTRIDEWAVVA